MTSLRARLSQPGPLVIAGAHNALSAKLVEEAGFDGIWASGFEISAARALPDANILTMVEQLEAARQMVEVARIPVVADCDAGFGNAVNVVRMTHDYERAGIAAICLEDNTFPKRCSFYTGVRRELADVREHAGKIRAALDARVSEEFLVIARTEALIAGYGLQEAVARAHAYADAGADMILVHSKAETEHELLAFAERWHRRVPLVCVPTTYKQASVDELHAAGFKMVIFANHALRSCVKAMQTTLRELRAAGRTAAAEPHVVPLKEIYRLVGVDQLQRQEEAYLSSERENVRAVILAAGSDDNLRALTGDKARCMLDIKGRSLLDRQVEMLNSFGITEIAVVRGYRKESVDLPNLRYYDNDQYEHTGEVVSLFTAREFLEGRVLVIYGDILFEPHVLARLLRSSADVSLVVDRAWADHRGQTKLPRVPDLVRLASRGDEAARRLSVDGAVRITEIGRKVEPADADGEFIGMMMLAPEATARMCEVWDDVTLRINGSPFHDAASTRMAALPDLLSESIAAGHEVAAVEIYKGWMEVDSFEHYRQVWANAST